MRWRTRSNGDIFAPKRGNPPQVPSGYVVDSRDPFLAHLMLPECRSRYIFKERLSCGKIETIIECHKFNIEVSQLKCSKCEVPDASSI